MEKGLPKYSHIRNLREDADLTQAQLAEHLNISQATYSYYELGGRDIPTSVLIELAKFHNVSVDYLLNLTSEKKPYPAMKKSTS